MPTGYTAGVIDGTTETFQDFAKQCMRAFGATIHMRDEKMSKEYEPRVPTDHHTEKLAEANVKLDEAKNLSDDDIIEMRKAEIADSKKCYEKGVKEAKEANEKLSDFLLKAKSFAPPTEDHDGIAKFMVEQLESTIEHDGSTDFYDKELAKLNAELDNINASDIREAMISSASWSIEYHTKENNAEIKRCNDSNMWVKQMLNAVNVEADISQNVVCCACKTKTSVINGYCCECYKAQLSHEA